MFFTIISVHNDLVRSIGNNHVSLLVLLDLSADFDTVDHNITAELGRALGVVKVTLQVNGNSQLLGVRPRKLLDR